MAFIAASFDSYCLTLATGKDQVSYISTGLMHAAAGQGGRSPHRSTSWALSAAASSEAIARWQRRALAGLPEPWRAALELAYVRRHVATAG
jgi:hypothetical protein